MLVVEEIMSSPPITCRPHDTLDRPAHLMWDHDCGSVIVTAAEGQIHGMITDRDICMAAYTRGSPLEQIRVSDVMSKRVCFCKRTAPVRWALLLMAHYRVRRLPVVDANGHAIGLISLNNLIRYAAWGDHRFRDELFETMDQICQPHWLEHQAAQITPAQHHSGVFERQHVRHAEGAISERKT